MRNYIFALIALFSVTSVIAADNTKKEQYKLNVQDFSELTIVDGVPVEYICNNDSAGWAIFICPPELASHIMFSNESHRLSIRTDSDEKPFVGIPKIRVYSSVLKKAVNSGDSTLVINLDSTMALKDFKSRQIGNGHTIVRNLNCESLEAGVTAGNGSMSLSGNARKAKLNNAGSGHVIANNLSTVNANCYVFGSGNIECAPSESLRIYGAGSGKVYYSGEPKITTRSIGVKAIRKN